MAGRVDRTYLAVRRQLEAMGCEVYEVGIRDRQGRMMSRTWTPSDALKAVPWLKRQNAQGADIYIRPAGEQNQGLILLDDLDPAQVQAMKARGIEPATVVETSPENYQAWVRLTAHPLSSEVAIMASKGLAAHFQADPNSADWRHYGRLVGFMNRKPEHTTETGHNPWVLCHEASGQQATRGPEFAQSMKQLVLEGQAQVERENRLRGALSASERVYGRDPVKEYQRQAQRLMQRYGKDADFSRLDWMIATDMAKQGYSAEQLEHALERASPELPVRKAGHEQDYARRTVRAAFADPEVQKHLEVERTRERGPSRGR